MNYVIENPESLTNEDLRRLQELNGKLEYEDKLD